MVNIYDEIRDENGLLYAGRTKLYIKHSEVDDEGNFSQYERGTALVFDSSGYQFIVDTWVIPQIDKLKIDGGTLVVKNGEQLQEPIKSPVELRMEELEKELQMLKDKQSVQPVYTEEPTDKPTE